MMVQEAIDVSQSLGPDNNLIAHLGVKIPHPKLYSSEPDLKKFKTFITGMLWWLSMNLPLSSETTLLQVKYVGTHLMGDMQEWYI